MPPTRLRPIDRLAQTSCKKFYCRTGSNLDFGFAYGAWLDDDDIITNSTWEVLPTAGLTGDLINTTAIERNSIDQRIGTCTSVFFAPSAVGDYVLTNSITTRDGRSERFDLLISVLP